MTAEFLCIFFVPFRQAVVCPDCFEKSGISGAQPVEVFTEALQQM